MENTTERIEILAKKFLKKTITSAELQELEHWYAQDIDGDPVWKLEDRSKDDLKERLYLSITDQIEKAKPRSAWKYAVAVAAIAILALAGTLVFTFHNKKDQITDIVKTTIDGKVTKIHLPDSSIVWLKGNSKLTYPSHFTGSTRDVSLQGEALFEVAKDKNHPFIVKTKNYTAKVLGTSFNLIEGDKGNTFKLTVLTGRVSLMPTSSQSKSKQVKEVIVVPGEEFEINPDAVTPKIVSISLAEKAGIVKGTEYEMNFENLSFEEVKQRIENKFNIIIQSQDNLYSSCKLSADVTDQSLENTLKVLSSVLNSTYSYKNNTVNISGGGCK